MNTSTSDAIDTVGPQRVRQDIYDLHHDPEVEEDLQSTMPSRLYRTDHDTPYFKAPGVAMVSSPQSHLGSPAVTEFLRGFDAEEYQEDAWLPHGVAVAKFAGQTCYLSLGEARTKNKDAGKYFENIINSGHGSVLEHAVYGFLFWGVSRSFTHEIVRHRAGTAFSQVSQRYCGADKVRFVERPEYQGVPALHCAFEERIDRIRSEYEAVTDTLLAVNEANPAWTTLSRTERRKAVQQASRSCLPNETEAPIVVTANIRAWRGIFDQRLSPHAEPEIRAAVLRVYLLLLEYCPELLQDYRLYRLPDGSHAVTTEHRKV